MIGKNCKKEGQKGVEIILNPISSQKMSPSKVISDSNGYYSFENVFPGKFLIQASHPSWTLSKDKIEVELKSANIEVKTDFVVTGYDVSGYVVSSNEPVLGVNFLLFSDTIKNVECPKVTIQYSGDKKPLCLSTSDETGKFLFKNIPCGSYLLKAIYTGTNTVFNVAPSEIPITVDSGISLILRHAHLF